MSILYSGKSDGLVSLDQMRQLPAAQVLGPRHNPQPFHVFIDSVYDGLQDRGYEITESEFSLTDENNKFFGAVRVDHDDLKYSKIWARVCLRYAGNGLFQFMLFRFRWSMVN